MPLKYGDNIPDRCYLSCYNAETVNGRHNRLQSSCEILMFPGIHPYHTIPLTECECGFVPRVRFSSAPPYTRPPFAQVTHPPVEGIAIQLLPIVSRAALDVDLVDTTH
jgi:hypothetical protein